MDGCICSFEAAVETLSNPDAKLGLADDATEAQKQVMYDAIENDDVKFWSAMPWKNDGKQLWMLLKPYKPTLLTSPGEFTYAIEGKKYWVQRCIPGTPIFFSDNKAEFVNPYETSILIDDNKINISAWKEAGGVGILHTSFEETEKEFLELLWKGCLC